MMSQELVHRDIIDSLSAQIAILTESGRIIETNRAWREFGAANGLAPPHDSVGQNYLDVCSSSGDEAGELTAIGIQKVLSGELQAFNMQYPCHSPGKKRWFVVRVVRLKTAGDIRLIVSHENITPVVMAQEELKAKEAELSRREKMLRDTNTALTVLLEHREQDKVQLEENVLANVQQLVRPHLERLRLQRLDERSHNLLKIIASRLDEITSPFLNRFSSLHTVLTPREVEVAVLVREGRASKEIARILLVSVSAVDFHRKMIRKKLGLTHGEISLRSYLLSLQ